MLFIPDTKFIFEFILITIRAVLLSFHAQLAIQP